MSIILQYLPNFEVLKLNHLMRLLLPALLCMLVCTTHMHAQKSNSYPTDLLHKILDQENIQALAEEDYLITSSHLSSTSNILHSYFNQRYKEINVFDKVASIHSDASGTIVAAHLDLEKNLDLKVIDQGPLLNPKEAIVYFANHFGVAITEELQGLEPALGADLKQSFTAGGFSDSPISIHLVYQEIENNQYVLAWNIAAYISEINHYWNVRVHATTGEILDKTSWTVSCNHDSEKPSPKKSNCKEHNHNHSSQFNSSSAAASYNVYNYPLESPLSGARSLENDPADLIASPFGWHDTNGVPGEEYTVTRGNNCNAYEDGDNAGFQPDGGTSLIFDFALDTNYTSANQSESAVITNLFYWTNLCHDIWYQYGFDESSGNFQENNYGNGGLGGDYCRAEAQDGAGTCNANMSTPVDGSLPKMQMYVCGDRDGDLDNGVIVHEYGHGISNRLTGGAGNSGCLNNQEQMGEGWSDYFGMMMTIESGDAGTDVRAMGNWLLGNGPNGPGIRPYPYSTDLVVNPHTYDDIKTEVAPHGVGSVWCAMLWEMTWGLINEIGYDSDLYYGTGGNNVAMALVIEGLKLQPCSPGFVDGRDAILKADTVLYGAQYSCLIWEAFAKRGLGFSADQGSTGNKSDGIESYDLPIFCQEPTINFNQVALSTSESEASLNPPLAGDCRTYTDFELGVSLSVDASGPTLVSVSIASNSATELRDFELFNNNLVFNAAGTQVYVLRIFDDASIESPEEITLELSITNPTGTDAILGNVFEQSIFIQDNDYEPGLPAPGTLSETDFESGVGGFTSNNINGGDPYFHGTAADASSNYWTVPANGSTNIMYANDDDCNCDMSNVLLYTPVFDLSNLSNSVLSFNAFFEGRTYQGNTESAHVLVSTDGGSSFSNIENLAGIQNNWRMESIDVSAYDGMSNVQFAFKYNDHGGWVYGAAFDDVELAGDFAFTPNIASNLNDADEQVVPPNETVYFYNSTGELIAHIENGSHDFGCVEVVVDRTGTGVTSFWDNDPSHALSDKTVLVSPSNNSSSASYLFGLYMTDSEVNGWEIATGLTWDQDVKLIKHPTAIADVTPTNPEPNGPGSIEQDVTEAGSTNFLTTAKFVTANFSTGFSGIGVGNPGQEPSLPVDLVYFDGEKDPSRLANYLYWNTESESNNDFFEIQRSTDGINFKTLDKIDGLGTTTESNSYFYTDSKIASRPYFYRLKQIDFDGTSYISDLIYLSRSEADHVFVAYPNPSSKSVLVDMGAFAEAENSFSLFNTAGQEIALLAEMNQDEKLSIDTGDLVPGTYYLKIYSSELSEPKVIKFVKI